MIPDRLAAAAFDDPDAVFLIVDDVLTYGEADDRVGRVAGGLVDRGIGEGDRVAVWGGTTLDTAVALLAVGRMGAVAVPLNQRLPDAQAIEQAEQAGVAAWICDVVAPVPDAWRVADLHGDVLAGRERSARDDALIVFTSGTTGPPKAVRLSRGALDASARSAAQFLSHTRRDRWLAALPLCHVGGIQVLIRSALVGGSAHLLERFDPATFGRAARASTLASVVAPMLRRLLDAGVGAGSLRAVVLGGGPVPPGLLEDATAAGWPVLVSYGQTETASQVATCPPERAGEPIAVPLPGVEIRAVDVTGEPVDDGWIEVRGPSLFSGYLGGPTRAASDWHRTGDLGRFRDGVLSVAGRADAVIVTGGEKVNPEAVERALVAAGADDALVVGVPDPEWGERVAALVVGDPVELETAVRDALAGFALPRRWMAVERIPRTPLDKPDRAAAKRMLSQDPGRTV